jgi:uncharacterized membrane protein YfcA
MSEHKDDDDPIGDYVQWTKNRYLPGAYLGGNLPPWLRQSQTSPRTRRRTGLLVLIGAVMGGAWLVAWCFAQGPRDPMWIPAALLSGLFVLLSFAVAISMIRSKPSSDESRRRHPHQHFH